MSIDLNMRAAPPPRNLDAVAAQTVAIMAAHMME